MKIQYRYEYQSSQDFEFRWTTWRDFKGETLRIIPAKALGYAHVEMRLLSHDGKVLETE